MAEEEVKTMDIIMEELKKEGLELGEESLKLALEALYRAIPNIVARTPNKTDDMLLLIMPALKPALEKLIENVNPEDNA